MPFISIASVNNGFILIVQFKFIVAKLLAFPTAGDDLQPEVKHNIMNIIMSHLCIHLR